MRPKKKYISVRKKGSVNRFFSRLSGYDDDILDRYKIQISKLNLLEKPFSSEELLSKTRNLLAQVERNTLTTLLGPES